MGITFVLPLAAAVSLMIIKQGGTVYFHSVNLAVSHLFLQNIRKWGVAQDFHSVVPLAYTSNWPVPITGFNINTRDLWFMTHHLVEVNLCFCYLVTLLEHSHRHDGLFNGSWFMEDKLLNNMQNPIFMYWKLFICHSSLPFFPSHLPHMFLFLFPHLWGSHCYGNPLVKPFFF